jgi:O-acetyl-ADP-ribose deacetylase
VVIKKEPELLANCYTNSLKLAVENNIKTIAFPNISTGVYGYPKKEAATVAVTAVQEFLETNESIEKVIFVCFDDENLALYRDLL